jgi:hypothetical protein
MINMESQSGSTIRVGIRGESEATLMIGRSGKVRGKVNGSSADITPRGSAPSHMPYQLDNIKCQVFRSQSFLHFRCCA